MRTFLIKNNAAILSLLRGDNDFEYQESTRRSTIGLGFQSCRKLANRNVSTGKLLDEAQNAPIDWLSIFGYFALLDALGSMFQPNENHCSNHSSIFCCVKNFGFDLISNDERKLNALVSLRNSFIHDFNLVDIPRNESAEKFRFEVDFVSSQIYTDTSNRELNIVCSANEIWDGNLHEKDFFNYRTVTRIYLSAIAELVEKIYERIKVELENNSLNLRMKEEELINKYTCISTIGGTFLLFNWI